MKKTFPSTNRHCQLLCGFLMIGLFILSTFLPVQKAQAKTSITSSIRDPGLIQTLTRSSENTVSSVERFLHQLGLTPRQTSKTLEIKIFTDPNQMLEQLPTGAALESNSYGYFHHETFQIGIWHGGDSLETGRIFRHEIVHHALHAHLEKAPPVWFDEGLAELLSRDPQALQSLRTGGVPQIVKNILWEAKQSGALISLEDLFQLDHDTFYGANKSLNYATSYALTAYVLNQEGPRVLTNLIGQGENGGQWLQTKMSISLADYQEKILTWALSS